MTIFFRASAPRRARSITAGPATGRGRRPGRPVVAALASTGMTHPETLHVTVRGGAHDGETFDLPAGDAGAGDTIPYLDAHYRLIRAGGQDWIARLVRDDLDH